MRGGEPDRRAEGAKASRRGKELGDVDGDAEGKREGKRWWFVVVVVVVPRSFGSCGRGWFSVSVLGLGSRRSRLGRRSAVGGLWPA
jgi:hypothetical protein